MKFIYQNTDFNLTAHCIHKNPTCVGFQKCNYLGNMTSEMVLLIFTMRYQKLFNFSLYELFLKNSWVFYGVVCSPFNLASPHLFPTQIQTESTEFCRILQRLCQLRWRPKPAPWTPASPLAFYLWMKTETS